MTPNRIMMELARYYAAWGKKDEALRWLEKSLNAGFPNAAQIKTDDQFTALKNDPGFIKLTAAADPTNLSRTQGWRSDIQLLSREIKRLHYNPYRNLTPPELNLEIKNIEKSIPQATDEEMTVRIMKLMRLLGDGHTYAEGNFQNRQNQRALPVLFALYEEGIYISAATPDHEDLLWAKVLKFDNSAADKVYEKLAQLSPQDNPMRPKSVAPGYMRYPQILNGLSLIENSHKVSLTITDREGRNRVVQLETTTKTETDWLRKPTAFKTEGLPLYLQNRTNIYWFKYIPETELLYFQYNAVDERANEPVEQFAAHLTQAIEKNEINKFVIDLRWNGGGDVFRSKAILAVILNNKKINQPGKLFVIIGRHTFSAAMIFTEQLERYTNAIFVGEPTGSSPNFVGETNLVTLPYSKIRVSISNLYWQNSNPQDYRIWIDPKIYVRPTFDDYSNGRDAALNAILSYGQ